MKKVQVLMSTYNGEKYLKQQLDSIMSQIDVDVYILARDDGSSDSTCDILREYQRRYPEKIAVLFENNIGVKHSFIKLIQISSDKMDYYAFADQDDLWDKDKMCVAINRLTNENKPMIYGSNVQLYNQENVENANVIFNRPFSLGNFLVKNFFPGCTIVFNKVMRELISIKKYDEIQGVPLHDHWLCLVCMACDGVVIYDNEPHIKYRQHSENVVGYRRNFIKKIKSNGIFSKDRRRYHIACELYDIYINYFNENTRKLLSEIVNYDAGLMSRIKMMFNSEIDSRSSIQNFILKLMFLLKKY